MKKLLLIPLIFLCYQLFSEDSNVYTGNATRGSDSSFNIPGGEEGLYGISMIVPAGKTLRVTNLKNNKTAEILIVEGKGKPGIQLLLNSQAADVLDIHPGEIPQVTSVELGSEANPFLSYNEDPEGFKQDLEEEFFDKVNDDPDYGTSVDVEEEMTELGYETASPTPPAAQLEEEKPEIIIERPPEVPVEEDKGEFEDIIIANVKDDVDDTLEIENSKSKDEPVMEEEKTEEPIGAPEVIVTDEVVKESADTNDSPEAFLSDIINTEPEPTLEEPKEEKEITVNEELPESPAKNPGSVIYFLTQAEPRPPQIENAGEDSVEEEIPAIDEKKEGILIPLPSLDGLEIDGSMNLFTPQYVEPEEFKEYIGEIEKSGSRFIQIINFSEDNKADLMKNMEELFNAFPYLPIAVDNEKNVLLAGPVSRDEVGILLYAVKAHGFKDAIVKRVDQ
jgi:hypothetical protein